MLAAKAHKPIAVFSVPVVLSLKALKPTAVLFVPVVLTFNALAPTAVLFDAVFENKAHNPIEILLSPNILENND